MTTSDHGYRDLIIIGAGPAGSAAARRARTLGLSVTLIERGRFPRNKLCGAGITMRSVRSIVATFGEDLPRDLYISSHDVSFKWNGEVLTRFRLPVPMRYSTRVEMDEWLALKARDAGTDLRDGTRVEAIDTAASTVTLSDGETLRYGVLLGADGVASRVAKELWGRSYNPETVAFGYEVEVPVTNGDEAPMSIDFGIARWGYGWNFPKSQTAAIGVARMQWMEGDLRRSMEDLVRHEGHDPENLKTQGAFLPGGEYHKVPGRGAIILAGDAAGLIDSLTGEGISTALESGALAAEAAAEALQSGTPSNAATILKKLYGPMHREMDKCNRLRGLVYMQSMQEQLKDKLRNSVTLRARLGELIAVELTYTQLEKSIASSLLGKLARWPTGILGSRR